VDAAIDDVLDDAGDGGFVNGSVAPQRRDQRWEHPVQLFDPEHSPQA
jgi:hypothetical protein